MIPESLPWPILNTNEHQTNLRNKRSLSRRGRRNSAPPKPIYIEGKKLKFTVNNDEIIENIFHTKNPASRASKRTRLVAMYIAVAIS